MKYTTKPPGRTRRLLALLVSSVLSLALAPAAHAGTYDVYSCKDPATGTPLGPTSPSGWQYYTSHPGETNWSLAANCDTASGGYRAAPFHSPVGGLIPGDASNPRFAVIQFDAPAATVIRAYEMWRAMHVSGQRAIALVRNHPGAAAEFCHGNFSTCIIGDYNSPLSPLNRVTGSFDGTGAQNINLQIICDGPGCEKNSTIAGVKMFAARFTLEENENPTFTSPPAGSLLEGGKISGTRTLDFVASDVGSGVHRIEITSSAAGSTVLASKVTDSGNGRCAAAKFAYVVPCPTSIDDSVTVNTLQFPDGAQTITIKLQDAAGNTKSVQRTIDVKNAPESTDAPSVGHDGSIGAGDTLTCNPGTFSPAPESITYAWLVAGAIVEGQTASAYVVRSVDVGKSIVCRVTAHRGGGQTTVTTDPVGGTGQPGGPTGGGSNTTTTNNATTNNVTTNTSGTGSGATGGANGTGGELSSARFTSDSRRTIRSRFGRVHVLTGRLVDANGQPIRGASIDVLEQVRRTGASWLKLGAVHTDENGVYTYRTPAGPSRTVRFAYAGRIGSSDYRDTADVLLKVKAVLRVKAKRRALPAGGTLRLQGRVLGGRHLPKGATVEIQARDGRRWRTISIRRLSRTGKTTFRYRFRRTRNATFLFRVALRQNTSVPMESGRSRAIRIRVA